MRTIALLYLVLCLSSCALLSAKEEVQLNKEDPAAECTSLGKISVDAGSSVWSVEQAKANLIAKAKEMGGNYIKSGGISYSSTGDISKIEGILFRCP